MNESERYKDKDLGQDYYIAAMLQARYYVERVEPLQKNTDFPEFKEEK